MIELKQYNKVTWQWWKSLRSWLLRCQRRFFLSPKVLWHLLHLKGRSLLWTTLMWRSRSPRRVKRASHRSQAWGRSWACVFKWALSELGFIIRWHDRHSMRAPSPSPTTMVRTWIRPSPSSSNSSKSSAFYKSRAQFSMLRWCQEGGTFSNEKKRHYHAYDGNNCIGR